MKITLNEKEIKTAIIMFLSQKMSLDSTVDVELLTQGKGGQTIVATVDLDVEDLPTKTPSDKEEEKENTNTQEEAVTPKIEASNPDNNDSLFSNSDDDIFEEPKKEEATSVKEESPFGSFM